MKNHQAVFPLSVQSPYKGHIRRTKNNANFRCQKQIQNKPLIPACLDHDNLSLAVVMLMKDVPSTES
jgi:hypothetical protein